MRDKQGTNVTDYSRYGNDGALTGCKWVENGLEFNGTSYYVDCGNDASLDITDALTVSMWIYSPTATTNGGICNKYSGGIGFILDTAGSNDLNFMLYDGVNNISCFVAGINNKQWNFITAVLSGRCVDGLKMYVNGSLKTNSDSTTIGSITNVGQWIIGYNDRNSVYFKGSISDVRIHNYALNASEIKAYYDSTKHRYI